MQESKIKLLSMTEEIDFETYLSISKYEFQIFLFDKKNLKNIYKSNLKLKEHFDFTKVNNLSEFLDENIYKIEKLAGNFIKNIFLIIENEQNLQVNISIKKKIFDNIISRKYLENSLIELKNLYKENFQDQNLMHMIILNYLINEKNYLIFEEDLNSDHLCLDVNFISISNDLVIKFDKVLEKYQIKINQYLDGIYIKKFFNEKNENIELSEMAYKIVSGYNLNEVNFIPKNVENKGFFEKFFQLFS